MRARDNARWSTLRQIRQAGLCAEQGLILGSWRGHLLRDNGPEHVLLVGKTQLGRKSTSFVIPNLLSWRQSVIVHDPKCDLPNEKGLYPVTAGWRQTFSHVVKLAPTSSTSDRYNLLDVIPIGTEQEVRAVQLVSGMLADPDGRGFDHMSDAARHFIGLANIGLNGLVLYGLYTQRARSLGALRAFYMSKTLAQHGRTLRRYPHPLIQEAGQILCQVDGQNEASGFFSTVALSLWAYSDPLIQRATDTSDFTLRDLRERARPMSLYLCIPFSDHERLRGWLRAVLHQVTDYCVSTEKQWRWKMLGLFEETPSLKRLRFLHEGLNYVAESGFRICIITPTMNELIETYGRHHHFFEGCGIKLMFGVGDRAIAAIYSGDLGERRVWRQRRVGGQVSGEWEKIPLMSPTAVMDLPMTKGVVMAGGGETTPRIKVIVRKTYYKAHPVWLARSEMPAA